MKQLRTLDLTRIKVVENMEYIQTMRKKTRQNLIRRKEVQTLQKTLL